MKAEKALSCSDDIRDADFAFLPYTVRAAVTTMSCFP